MLKSQVRSAIFDAVAAKVTPLGFRSNKKEWSFTRNFEGGFHRIGFSIADYSPTIIVTPMVTTRLDLVDELANRFNTSIAPEARAMQTAVLVLPDYFPGRPQDYNIASHAELADKTSEILDVLETDMLPFAERCVDLSFVESVLRPESGEKLKPNPLRRALTLIAIASLCGRQDMAAIGATARAPLELRNVPLELQIFDQTLEYILKGSMQ